MRNPFAGNTLLQLVKTEKLCFTRFFPMCKFAYKLEWKDKLWIELLSTPITLEHQNDISNLKCWVLQQSGVKTWWMYIAISTHGYLHTIYTLDTRIVSLKKFNFITLLLWWQSTQLAKKYEMESAPKIKIFTTANQMLYSWTSFCAAESDFFRKLCRRIEFRTFFLSLRQIGFGSVDLYLFQPTLFWHSFL